MKKPFLLKLFATVMLICLSMAMLTACEDVNVEVTFIVDDEVYAVVNLQDGDTVEMPEDPTKDGFVFDGWYLDKDIWKKPFIGKVEDTTLVKLDVYAKWVEGETQCNHMWSQWTVGVEPTCSAEGKKGRYCLRCGKGEAADIEKLAHTEEVIPAVEATCYKEGSTEGTKCSVCNEILIAPQTVAKTEHNYGDWIVDEEANCTNAGSQHKICQNEGCEDRVDEEIPTNDEHNFANGFCTRCGRDVNYVSDGLEFTLNEDGLSYSVVSKGSCTDTDIVIPAVHNEKPVTRIETEAFKWDDELTSVTIPDSVTSIGADAFYDCSCLASITIPDSVMSIGDCAFYDCSCLTSITIPDSVMSIGDYAFCDCSGVESITVAIGNTKYASENNCLIETESKTLILGCKNSIIPDDGSVTSIGASAFNDCIELANITIPDSVTSIDSATFKYCSGLTSITISDSVTSIDSAAFYGCENLTEINFNGTVEQWNAIKKGENWNVNVPATKVICSDGEVEL